MLNDIARQYRELQAITANRYALGYEFITKDLPVKLDALFREEKVDDLLRYSILSGSRAEVNVALPTNQRTPELFEVGARLSFVLRPSGLISVHQRGFGCDDDGGNGDAVGVYEPQSVEGQLVRILRMFMVMALNSSFLSENPTVI